MRWLMIALFLFPLALTSVEVLGQDAATYAEQLREYDRRVAEAQALEADRQSQRWLPPVAIFGILAAYLVYAQFAARRRLNAIMAQTQANVDRGIEQNQEIIDLLKSIDERLGKGT